MSILMLFYDTLYDENDIKLIYQYSKYQKKVKKWIKNDKLWKMIKNDKNMNLKKLKIYKKYYFL